MVTTPFDDVTVLAHFPVGVNAKKSSNSDSFSSAIFPCQAVCGIWKRVNGSANV